ncbi:nickel-dependent hydrogenase large subunit [Notoacmeibacter sp. MSK16QG-6]|uniref:nickel-dependent hydrogenase large subunit n=1 Tax=Notoacmeibacter sp. MSK16QG-6 TaxID=2957982 RepID=UPI00209CBEC0|nr:nickel-dependent hydrogenase large subunit [Notoacmeibacter sp. MSK16QG-6]MCP1198376.1 nickel-dependent hydrogenase large subunit [Notoacmeibacter sp. MSK16QG-6]
MTDRQLLVGPFNRVEGDLELKLDISNGKVSAAYANSPLFRGFERMLLGMKPSDALTITPRICGICSISQSAAAAFGLADAAGAGLAREGEKVATLLHAVENVADHITHFNLFFMPDFARAKYEGRSWHAEAVARFTAEKGSSLHQTVAARAELLHIVGLLGGKWPHTLAIQPGGVTRAPTARDIIRMGASLKAFRKYLEERLFAAPLETFLSLSNSGELESWTSGDAGLFVRIANELGLSEMGEGPGRYMSYGAYPMSTGPLFAAGRWADGVVSPVETEAIREDVSYAWMLGDALHPTEGQTLPDAEMREPGYSWCKAPRLGGQTVEVGAMARQIVDGHPLAVSMATGKGVLGRITGRLIEIARTQIVMEELLASIDVGQRFMDRVVVPENGEGVGLVEAARGSLGHWMKFEDGEIVSYQIIAPTTWNFSPRDASGVAGPVEAALVGAPVDPDEETPVSVQHIVRSFDPCMVCTVH